MENTENTGNINEFIIINDYNIDQNIPELKKLLKFIKGSKSNNRVYLTILRKLFELRDVQEEITFLDFNDYIEIKLNDNNLSGKISPNIKIIHNLNINFQHNLAYTVEDFKAFCVISSYLVSSFHLNNVNKIKLYFTKKQIKNYFLFIGDNKSEFYKKFDL